jgi:hypothetical protein
VITTGAFDSQNLAFWDPLRGLYVDYHRTFTDRVRNIMTATSSDYVNWTEPKLLQFPGAPKQHLYTNAIRRYPRAPHMLIGFPTRYLPKHQQVEPIFMSSRDGVTFHRWDDPVIPQSAPEDRDGNRSNYMTNALVVLPENDREYAVYATEAYYTGPDSRVRRFTYRLDGFVSLHAGTDGGTMVTLPLVYSGEQLSLNFKTGEGGSVEVQLLEGEDGQVLLGTSGALSGDEIDQTLKWSNDSIAVTSGKPVRLMFRLKNADVYSFRFGK